MRISRLNVFAHALTLLMICTVVAGQEKAPAKENLPKYRNPRLAIDDRVADLLSRMTPGEKIGEIAPGREQQSVNDSTGNFTDENARGTLMRGWEPDLEFSAE